MLASDDVRDLMAVIDDQRFKVMHAGLGCHPLPQFLHEKRVDMRDDIECFLLLIESGPRCPNNFTLRSTIRDLRRSNRRRAPIVAVLMQWQPGDLPCISEQCRQLEEMGAHDVILYHPSMTELLMDIELAVDRATHRRRELLNQLRR